MIRTPDIDSAIRAVFGEDRSVVASGSLGGGCIARAQVLTLDDGLQVFCKSGADGACFAAEADGLAALAATGTVRVPTVYACSGEGAAGFLLLEYCPAAPMADDYWPRAGRALAALHAQPRERHGWPRDNVIGSSPQENGEEEHWPRFFAERRLLVQLRLLDEAGAADAELRGLVEGVVARIDELLPAARPALVHGDLWSGNLIVGPAGEPVYIDPAVYCGHGEVDLAMSELFGGFPAAFYRAYDEVLPRDPGYQERRDLYNSYHMLNHLLLFGGGYGQSARALLRRYC